MDIEVFLLVEGCDFAFTLDVYKRQDQIMSFLAAMKDSKAEKPTTTQQEVTDND